jgi:uncharacterized membrane protein/protein-disulfide isomerase
MRQFLKHKKPIIPLAYRYYFIPTLIIALTGFFDSIYLAVSHYRNYVDMGYQSFCAISKAFNCDTVSQSPYSILLDVPVPVWGIMGYGFFLFLLVFAWQDSGGRKRMWTLMMLVALGFSVYSVVLAFISSYLIRTYCLMCILSYAVNLALLFFAWLIRNRFGCEPFFKAFKLDILFLLDFSKISIPVAFCFSAAALIMMLSFPPYWQMDPPVLSKNTPTGVTADGHPWIGAENPELTIVEFSDYRCFQCKKMHYFLRRLIEANPDKIRMVHRHFPMDHTINPIVQEPFHPGAAKFAIVSLFALQKGKFWEMNDLLFDIPKDISTVNLRYLAKETAIEFDEIRYVFRDRQLLTRLIYDIREGLGYELTGTPGFIIDERIYLAQIPSEILRPYLK